MTKSEYFGQIGIEENIKKHKELTPPKAIKLARFGMNIDKVMTYAGMIHP